jgi:Cytochrome c oxidase subunit IIa family
MRGSDGRHWTEHSCADPDHMKPPDRDFAREGSNEPDDAALERAMRAVPSGAAALAGLTVALLLVFWFVVYLVVYLPRGLVG